MLAILGQEILSFGFLEQETTVPDCFDSGLQTFLQPIGDEREDQAGFPNPDGGRLSSDRPAILSTAIPSISTISSAS
jgi:hypothetical protein